MRDAVMAERASVRWARVRKPMFRAGDFVECRRDLISPQGVWILREGAIYVVARVRADGLVLIDGKPGSTFAPCRFKFLKRQAIVYRPPPRKPVFRPYVGTLDQYGPEVVTPEPISPVLAAVGRRWPAHPGDAALLLNELA